MDYNISSLSDVVERYLKDQILASKLKSGVKIVESEIAQTLDISRAPVREALRSLSQQELIMFSPRRGHFVQEMPREEIFEVFQIRITLELQILRMLVQNHLLTGADYDALTELARQMRDAHHKEEFDRVYLLNSLDLAFHRYLWDATKSVRRSRLLEELFLQLLIVMNNNIASLGSCDEKAEEHMSLIQALKTDDDTKVCSEFRNHLDKYMVAALGDLSQSESDLLEMLFQC